MRRGCLTSRVARAVPNGRGDAGARGTARPALPQSFARGRWSVSDGNSPFRPETTRAPVGAERAVPRTPRRGGTARAAAPAYGHPRRRGRPAGPARAG
ncbi:hypothetical protein SCOCK_200004 [Actinacidiphila cocklensis]|uniref:Uncharacterized protein n=1 Tax=Actinacidiphila cocklensis TaxID=887465 RepID=A0A9W4GQH0_9ACTN|nr:hypothetical protein SCOCK_200004 [Actinacidiphila cocklensis]